MSNITINSFDNLLDYIINNSYLYNLYNHYFIRSLYRDYNITLMNDQYTIDFDIECSDCGYVADASLRDSINNSLSNFKYNIDISTDSVSKCKISKEHFSKNHINRVKKFFIKKQKYVQDPFSHFIYELNDIAFKTVPAQHDAVIQKHNFNFKQINIYDSYMTDDKSCYFLLECSDCKVAFERILTGRSNKILEMKFDRAYYYTDEGTSLKAYKDFEKFKEMSCNDFIIDSIL